jgi:hypothetical protein
LTLLKPYGIVKPRKKEIIMTREEFNQFLKGISKETKVSYMLDNSWEVDNDISIFPTDEWVNYAELPILAKVIKQSNLTLTYEFIRTGIYYEDYKEADTAEELVSDQEVKDYFKDYCDQDNFEAVAKDLSTY